METDKIIIRGARQHNLKNIDVVLPRNRLVVITGLSGSGKSTLAFDTLYAEGQRRYVESLSTYARQFLERMDKPDVDMIEGLSPAIAIEQKAASHNPRSTVGTVTEIYDYLRLLYARIGRPHCHRCGKPIKKQSVDQIADQILALPENRRIIISAPMVTAQKGTHQKLLARLKKDGFARVRIDGTVYPIEDVGALKKSIHHTIDVVIDRLIVNPNIRKRLADSLELALAQSGGRVHVEIIDDESLIFSETAACTNCSVQYPEFTPASFSFNSPQGACPHCDGLGTVTEFDPGLIVPNPELSLREGAVAPWANRNSVYFHEFLESLTQFFLTDIYTPFQELSPNFQNVLLYGSGNIEIPFRYERDDRRYTSTRPFEGVIPNLQRRYVESDSSQIREEIKQYMNFRPCPECEGRKLNPASRSVRIDGQTISDLTARSIEEARDFLQHLDLYGKDRIIADRIVKAVTERLGFLVDVGLPYLTLDRAAATLSGGENQRIRLATQVGSRLTGVLYVLDEPSIGLHQRDHQRLLQTLMRMRDLGNTVLVVEHDEETIRSADFVVDMGPGAGMNGGHVVFSGSPAQLSQASDSLTGQYLSGRKKIETPPKRRGRTKRELVLTGCRENNLQGIDAAFPMGRFVCVTGVSGSGKSSLVLDTLYPALLRKLYRSRIRTGKYDSMQGISYVDKVIHIDQSPIGKTPRSNPGTYTGLFSTIRDLFARTPDARMRGYKPGRFSFNVKGGRCESCKGDGLVKIEMHFLPDVFVTCEVCRGKRYNRETLDIRYKGKTIADVLNMTVNQALAFFSRIRKIREILETLVDVGLGYIRLGQPATTLSGGEAQRVKLSRELSRRNTGNTVYILDEPTTGLHSDDIRRLLLVLNRLVEQGNTVIVIEHHMDVIKMADHIIDLGPEGGEAGGKIILCGTPEEISRHPESHTGVYLRRHLRIG